MQNTVIQPPPNTSLQNDSLTKGVVNGVSPTPQAVPDNQQPISDTHVIPSTVTPSTPKTMDSGAGQPISASNHLSTSISNNVARNVAETESKESLATEDSLTENDLRILHPFVFAPEEEVPQESPTMFCLDSILGGYTSYNISDDSTSNATDTIVWHKSLFAGHTLQPTHKEAIERNVNAMEGWMPVGTIVIGILAYIYLRGHKMSFLQTVNAVFSRYHFDFLQRENGMNNATNYLPASMLCSVALALYAFVLDQHYAIFGITLPVFVQILLMAFLLFTLLLTRNGCLSFLGTVFDNRKATTQHIRTSQLCQLMLSVCMLPLLLMHFSTNAFHEYLIILISIIILLIIVIDFVRGILIVLTHPQKTNVYLIYYLCIVEIVPLIVLGTLTISL